MPFLLTCLLYIDLYKFFINSLYNYLLVPFIVGNYSKSDFYFDQNTFNFQKFKHDFLMDCDFCV